MKQLLDHVRTVVNLPKKLLEWLDAQAAGEKTRNQLIKDILLEKMKTKSGRKPD